MTGDMNNLRPLSLLTDGDYRPYTVNGISTSLSKRQFSGITTGNGDTISVADVIASVTNSFNRRSFFDICREISPYDTPAKVCRFFDADWTPYGVLKEASHGLRLDQFHHYSGTTFPELGRISPVPPSGLSREDLVAFLLNSFVCLNQRHFELNAAFGKAFGGWLRQTYAFKNEHGEAVQQAIMLMDLNDGVKRLVPCTSWMRDHHTQNECFCVPLPGKQILYNLDLLKSIEEPTVILTDSIEIAALNQPEADPGVVWTSWLRDETALDAYDQVDWSPLEDAGQVYLLVTNHSGMSLAEAYLDAYDLADYLQEERGVALKFIQVEVDFGGLSKRRFDSLAACVEARDANPPSVNPGSVMALESFEEFEALHKQAVAELATVRRKFYERRGEDAAEGDDCDRERRSSKKDPIDYLLRPVVARRGITLLHAPTGHGKSALVFSLCAAIVSGHQPFANKWWTCTKGENKFRKVLYFDFELGESEHAQRRQDFVNPYLPPDAQGDFIIIDMKGQAANYLDEAGRRKLLDLVDKAKGQGTAGQPVDLVVFDTYTKLAGTEHTKSWETLLQLMNKIMNAEAGAGVLLVHHSSQKDGRSVGFEHKDIDFFTKIKLNRATGAEGSPADPMSVEIEKWHSFAAKPDRKPFHVRWDGKKWAACPAQIKEPKAQANGSGQVDKAAQDAQDTLDLKEAKKAHKALCQEFVDIVNAYTKAKFRGDAIAWMMGMARSTLHEKLKEYEQLAATPD